MTTRQFSRSGRQQLISVEEFMATKDNDVVICTSQSVLEIARVFLRTRAQWATTYVDSYVDDGYVIATPAQMDIIQEYIAEFMEDTSEMNCNDFNDALLAIGSAITDLGTLICGCAGGGGSAGAPGQEPTAETFEDDGLDFPPSFSSRAEYDAYKCNVANSILASIQADLGWVTAAAILQLTVPALAIAFFTPVPFDELAIILGTIVALFIAGTMAGIISAINAYISANAEDLVCALYNASNATSAKSDLKAEFSGGLTAAQASLVNLWVNFANMNGLFGRSTILEGSSKTMGVACLNCNPQPHFTHIGQQIGEFTWEPAFVSGVWHVAIAFYAEGWTTSAEPTRLLNVDLYDMPGFTPKTDSTHGYRGRSNMGLGDACIGWDEYCTDIEPIGEYCLKKISLRSTTNFSVTFAFGADC